MIHEYIITAFKVMVGVITENRLALSALVALGILLIWMFLSLVFSFQWKFANNVKRLNEYISRNGFQGEAKNGFELIIAKMPSEFQKGYKKYLYNKKGLPSDYIKRFECLDMELSGGVFNQNKSVLKTFIHFVFVSLTIFSLALIPVDEPLTGYSFAEALVIPLVFFIFAKILYYVYTAIRQYQYKCAIEEFNFMLENMDRASDNSLNKISSWSNAINESEKKSDDEVKEIKVEEKDDNLERTSSLEESLSSLQSLLNDKNLEIIELSEDKNDEENIKSKKKEDSDNELEGEEVVEQKRGRGRPRKEVVNNGEFVITNDKEFEEALLRAEKLMRKNEEPLSASQTKRIEKQIKELVDAMTKYKEDK